MKKVTCYKDKEGRRHDSPKEAAKLDRIHDMRQISSKLIAEWQTQFPGNNWIPEVSELSVILQRLAMSKGFAVLRKVQRIQRKEAQIVSTLEKDDIPS